ncbi:signal peptide peptidase SppA [Lichenibacterium minor]|uniref:Signal peptide peptidase SppA n=1 Tax=Lichenibacterium minor TaxID=2316528 RepID=A0A4Q2U7W8_9HYPH|nr:signal peptide peptidase SppA [Lichenibacterium minor]RYC32502.1 signal peptide peptidase SppA [Lichenibacterium minor]
MSMTPGSAADYLVDRRRIRRKLTFWRVLAAAVAVLAVVALFARDGGAVLATRVVPHVARVKIGGLITGDDTTLRLLHDVETTDAAKALVLQIESPGGTTVGSERVYDAIRKVAAKKPVVATVDTLAASGAYIAALGADHIVAYGNSLVGSIGVLFQFPNVSGLLDKIGVRVEEVKSAPLKAAPNGLEPTSDAARAALAALVSDSFDWFKGLVKSRRSMTDAELAAVDDGRVFTGRQGVPLKLVDELGSEEDAVRWLETDRHVAHGLPVRDYEPKRRGGVLGLLTSAASAADALGFPTVGRVAAALGEAADRPRLDGLTAVWQGASGQ